MKRLGKPPFACLITEGKLTPKNYSSERSIVVETIRTAVADGVDLVQIRERDLSARLLFDLATDVVTAVKDTGALVLLNDRADVALASGADGVHLRESSIPPAVVREIFPKHLVIGVSTHDVHAAQSAAAGGADFVFFGPVFESPGKGEPTGPDKLRDVCRAIGGFPVIALGGIDSDNVGLALDAGAAGVAGIRSMHDADERGRILRVIGRFARIES